jgi:predicted lipoprotein with Yx(FWY)xxD motif
VRRRATRRARAGTVVTAVASLALFGVLVGACGGTGATSEAFSTTPTTATGVTLSTELSPVGRILATPSGYTLYDFTPDTSTSSACTSGICVRLWPPLIATGAPNVGRGLDKSLVGTVRRPNGQLQVTYGGHPLYTWIGDGHPGMVTGQALLNVGGYWYVVAPDGEQVTKPFAVERSAVRH